MYIIYKISYFAKLHVTYIPYHMSVHLISKKIKYDAVSGNDNLPNIIWSFFLICYFCFFLHWSVCGSLCSWIKLKGSQSLKNKVKWRWLYTIYIQAKVYCKINIHGAFICSTKGRYCYSSKWLLACLLLIILCKNL